MAKLGKWIGGGLGWVILGPIGALLGFLVGSFLDGAQKLPARNKTNIETSKGDFVVSLLVLIAAVMKVDGIVKTSELDYVRSYFRKSFGEQAARESVLLLREILKQNIPVDQVGNQIKMNMDYSSRLQLLHLLYGISQADGRIVQSEVDLIHYISNRIGVTTKDERSIRAMFVVVDNWAYKILEINKDATIDDIKKAYRKMAMKYHPDKVSHLGEEFQYTAKEKFQKVNQAYELIKKERNFV
ncbi:MAG: DnaJ domain-containing protein [Bacteroidota bacterium]